MPKKIEKTERVNDILLGPIERPALEWLARHMPLWVTSDLLTIIGILASVLIFISYTLIGSGETPRYGFLWLASLGFVLNWFGDSLDGTLARYRHLERPRFGFFIDHSVDAFSSTAMFLGLGLSGMTPFAVGAMAAISYLMIMIHVHIKTFVTGVFEITSAKIGPTEIRLIAIIANTLVFFFKNPVLFSIPPIGEVTIITLFLVILTILFLGYFTIKTIVEGTRLALLDGKRLERRLAREEKKINNQKE